MWNAACLYPALVQHLHQPLVDDLAETLRMQRQFARDAEDPWFDCPELELLAIDSPDPKPRSRFHLPLALITIAVIVAGAAFLWT